MTRFSKSLARIAGVCLAAVGVFFMTAMAEADAGPLHGIAIEKFATNLGFVTDIAFAPGGALFYTDTTYKQVRVLDASGTQIESIPVPGAAGTIDAVLGIALDPKHATNSIIYIHYIDRTTWSNRVIRLKHDDGKVSGVEPLVDIPLPPNPSNPDKPCLDHNGGHLAFGPEGALYVSMGDNCHGELVQSLSTAQGKMLRVRPTDGAAFPGNPFADGDGPNDDRIWALGLRNPFGYGFDPFTGNLWASDNGPGCGDELNLIKKSGNYGWPYSSPNYFKCIQLDSPYLSSAWYWEKTLGVTGLAVYTGRWGNHWYGSLMVCDINTGNLHRMSLNTDRSMVTAEEVIDISPAQCSIDVESSPGGALFVAAPKTIYRLRSLPAYLPMIRK